MKKALLLFCISILGFSSMLFAQSGNAPFRFEMEAEDGVYPYEVISLGEKGFLVYYESDIISRTTARWSFVQFDVFFKKLWKKEVILNRDLEPVKQYSDSTNIGILFNYEGKKKPEFTNQLVSINIIDTSIFAFTIPISEISLPNHLKVTGKYCYFSILYKDNEILYQLNRKNQKFVKLSPNENKNQSVGFLKTNSNLNEGVICGMINNISRKNNQIDLITYDSSGIATNTFVIPAQSNYFYNTAEYIETGEDSILIIGNYLNSSERPNLIGGSEDKNTGIYVAVIRKNVLEKVKFYNFSRFENIYKYLTDKDLQRIRKKIGDDDDTQPGYSLNLSLLNQTPVLYDSIIIVMNEAYYAEYRTEENLSYDYYGRPFPTNRTIFDGYRYTNGIVCGISKNGDLLWDNNFALNNILTYQLQPRISYFLDSNNLVMTYNHNGEIASMIIQGNKIIQSTEYSKVETILASDFVLENEKSDILYWYHNYFLSYGYQTIRNTQKRGRSRVNVFYLTKMVYEYQ